MFYNNKYDNIIYLEFMVNACFESRYISQFKDWLMWLTIESEETKRGLG